MSGLTSQQQAALSLNKNISITAGAGSGKTKILVDRFLKIVSAHPAKVRRILAITFTKKAAAEMLERITSKINQKLLNCDDENEHHRYLLIRDQISGAAVSTIHGFCARVLREFPFEANLAPDFSEMDEMQAIVLRQQAINQTFAWLDENIAEDISEFQRLFTSLPADSIKKMLGQSLTVPYEMNEIKRHYADRTEDQHLQHLQEIWLNKIQPILAPETIEELQAKSAAILQADEDSEKAEKGLDVLQRLQALVGINAQSLNSPARLDCAVRLIFRVTKTKDRTPYQDLTQMGGKKSWSPAAGTLLKELSGFCAKYAEQIYLADAGPVPGKADRLWYQLTLTFLKLYEKCTEYYFAIKADTGLVDFEDLQLQVFNLLENNPEIAQTLASRFDYIMVDEFQDTNILQWLIIEKLAGMNNTLKKDKLFVVGDPKQSIYGFRNSDVRIFQDIKKLIAEQAGFPSEDDYHGNIIFPDSFRFLPRLNEFINTVFKHIFSSSDNNPFEVKYHPLTTQRNVPDSGSVELAVLNEKNSEAEYIAATIKSMISTGKTCYVWQDGEHERKIEFGDIAILLRSRNNLLELEQILRKYDIPFKTVGGVGFWQRQEIYDFYHLLRFLDNPSDDLALVGLLRSPFFLISDAVLFFVSRREPQHWLHKLADPSEDEPFSPEDEEKLRQILVMLNKWLDLRGRIPLEDLLYIIIEDADLRLTLAGELNGEQLVANMDKLIEQVRQFESAGIGGLSGLIQNINELIEEEMKEGEALINLDDRETVKVMTIHASKGLQFPVVFVPYLNTANARKSQNFYIDPEIGLAAKFNDGEDRDHQLLHLLKSQKRQKELAEARRLFYVAVTRTSNHLYLSAQLKKDEPESDSALLWLQEALQADGIDPEQPGLIEKNDYYLNIVHEFPSMNSDTAEKETFEEYIDSLISYVESITESDWQNNKRRFEVVDTPEAQVFSATRIMTFIKDPDEYYKRYHLGFFEGDYESFAADTYSTDLSMLRGKIVHRFFELLSQVDNTKNLIEQILFEFEVFEYELRDGLTSDMLEYQKRVMSSPHGREIINAPEFRNELAVTMKLGNHFLTGTLDRLYKNKEGLWEIIDYKTNRISSDDVSGESQRYLWQIKSYALLLSRLYPQQQTYPVSLYYLHPDVIDTHQFSTETIREISRKFESKMEEINARFPVA